MMHLDILIATFNDSIFNIPSILLPPTSNITYIIGHQVTNGESYQKIYTSLEERNDITIVRKEEKGLSKNRNMMIFHSTGDIVLICDDDVRLVDHIDQIIIDSFIKKKEADIITFKIEGMNKKYALHSYKHTFQTLASVSSIEIAMRRKTIIQKNIIFDECFGLGSSYPVGEELVFLTDAYKKGFNIYYEPKTIMKHEEISSGWKSDTKTLVARGAVFARIFGVYAFIVDIYSALKSQKYTPVPYPFWRGLKNMLNGSYYYLKEKKCR